MMSKENAWSVVEKYTRPDQPPMYRSLYGVESDAKKITDEATWQKLPFLTKDILISTPFRERLFSQAGDHIRASSGTSGKPPLFCPRTYLRHMDYRFEYHDFKGGILAYHVPATPYWHEAVQKSRSVVPNVITFDPKNAEASVRLAKIARVDAISTFAFHLTRIGECMEREEMSTQIRFIEICGEACTPQLFAYLRRVFPNATVIPFYGSSEVEDSPIGFPCHAIDGSEPLSVYHAKPSQYHELIEPSSGASVEPVAGAEGELVVTAYPGEPSALPLIRYRTGDVVRVVEEKCARHGSWSFTVLGRAELDFLKVPGGVLRADEVARVIRQFPAFSGEFEVHAYEEVKAGKPIMRIEMHVALHDETDLLALTENVARAIRINPTLSFADAALEGRIRPLSLHVLIPKSGVKSKRITRH